MPKSKCLERCNGKTGWPFKCCLGDHRGYITNQWDHWDPLHWNLPGGSKDYSTGTNKDKL